MCLHCKVKSKNRLEYVQPNILKEYPILCGMSMKGEISEYPPSGFTFRRASLTEEQFQFHVESMQASIGSGIGKKIVTLNQVHGNHIHNAGLSILPDGDGLYTNNPDFILGIALADCCGIMIYDPRNRAIMALHAGWRGAKLDIGAKGMEIMKEQFGTVSSDVLIWLTPSAGREKYEVGPEFMDVFPGYVDQVDMSTYFDLRSYIASTLIECGVLAQHIEMSTICTITDNRFHSFRREGNIGRNIAFLGLL
jgi:YfiH family protein